MSFLYKDAIAPKDQHILLLSRVSVAIILPQSPHKRLHIELLLNKPECCRDAITSRAVHIFLVKFNVLDVTSQQNAKFKRYSPGQFMQQNEKLIFVVSEVFELKLCQNWGKNKLPVYFCFAPKNFWPEIQGINDGIPDTIYHLRFSIKILKCSISGPVQDILLPFIFLKIRFFCLKKYTPFFKFIFNFILIKIFFSQKCQS